MTADLPLSDRGLLLGDGLFETLLALDGVLQVPDAHLARLDLGCVALGLPRPDHDQALAIMQTAIKAAGLETGRAAVRLTYTAGSGGRGLVRPDPILPRLFATAAPSAPPAAPAKLVLSSIRRNASSPTAHHKTLAYLDNVMARREALALSADEAVMCNTDGHLACAAASNLFWVTDGILMTPDLSCGVLPGITRAKVLATAQALGLAVQLAKAGPDALDQAEAIFLTNSLNCLWPVSHWQGQPVIENLEAEALVQALIDQVSSGV
jgi:branched-subunit amino acid aminotransferase/4-amino-4-deoxychorismate lyase